MLIKLVVGDWSGDGHDIRHDFIIESNLNTEEVKAAYEEAVRKIGIDLYRQVANEYEEPYLTRDQKTQMEKFIGDIVIQEYNIPFRENRPYDIDDYEYIDLYLRYIKLGNQTFEYKLLSDDDLPSINIGGYGLYV